jgi:putative ABC transport system permease protein
MQLKTLRRKVRGDLRANWGQFLAVWLVVTLGTSFYGATYPSGKNMLNSFYKTYDQLRYMDLQVQFDPASPDRLDEVRRIPGVDQVEGRLVIESGAQLDLDHQFLTTLRLISVPDDREPDVNRSDITNGHTIGEANEILLLKTFAKQHDIQPGDMLRVWINGEPYDLRVAGLVFNAEYIVAGRSPSSPFPSPTSFGVAWIRYSDLERMSGLTGQINDIVIHLDGPASENKDDLKDRVRGDLETLFANQSNLTILTREQTASGGVIDANINGNFPIMIFYSSVFIIGSTLITSILLARLIESERRRIGTMRAMGVTRGELIRHYLMYGVIIGVTGGIAGSIFGYLNSFWVMQTYITYIAGGTLPAFVNKPQIPFILLGFLITLTGSIFAGIYPVWVQSATPPGVALRPSAPKTPNAISRLQLRFLPPVLRQAIRSMLRVPGRSISTALGVAAGAMMIFSAFVLWDTMDFSFGRYFNAVDYDVRVDLNALTPETTIQSQFAEIDGVKAVQGALAGPVDVLRGNDPPFETIAISLDETDPFLNLDTLEGSKAFSSADGVWIGNNVARVLDVHPGDTLTLRSMGQEHEVEILGVVTYPLGSPIFIPRTLFIQWTPVFPVNMVLVRTDEGQRDRVQDELGSLPGIQGIEVIDDYEKDINFYLEYFRSGALIFGSFGYILTLAVLYNTVNGSLRERRDELAIQRALGSTRREIAVMVTLELLIMVIIGAVIGVPLGRAIGFALNNTYYTDFFGQVNTLSPLSYGIGLISLFVIVLLAEIPGLRAVQKVDLGQVSKSQSF